MTSIELLPLTEVSTALTKLAPSVRPLHSAADLSPGPNTQS